MSGANGTVGRIVVGMDGSEGSAAALRWAARLALPENAEVVVVHVLEPESHAGPLGLPRAVLYDADWREAVRDELEGAWCAPLREAGVRHRTRAEWGYAGPCLTEVAAEEHADLLVTGRRGLGGLAELLRDSVSAYATHHSPCPVAVVSARPRAA
jgi:nucleotide-binding universal stress UspA family protein